MLSETDDVPVPTASSALRAPHGRVAVPVSVVMTAYNHEKYVGEAIASILDQTYQAFELIVVNDGSTDDTEAIIRGFRDSRITAIRQRNRGESAAITAGLDRPKGRYIAFMDGDDVCHPRRLERQMDYLDAHGARAVTSWIDLIDDDGAPLHELPELLALANMPPCRTRAEIFRRLWRQNFLWPSSAMFERTLLDDIGGVCRTLAQLQDYALWIAIVKRAHIHTIPEPLLRYRIRAGAANASLNPANMPRVAFEQRQIYRRIFDGLPADIFRAAFADELRNPTFDGEREYAIERAFLHLAHPNALVREIGVEHLFGLMQDRQTAHLIETMYRFTMADFFILSNDPTHRALPGHTPTGTLAPG